MNRVGLTTFVTDIAHGCRGLAQPPPTGTAAWPCRPGVRLPETVIAFVRSYPCGIETVIVFAGAKWVFLVHFSGAEVLLVSRVPVQGRAVVMVVSQLPRAAPCARKSSPCLV